MDLQDKHQDKKLQVLLFFTGIKEENIGLAKWGWWKRELFVILVVGRAEIKKKKKNF